MITPEQVKERVNYIGASDAAAVLGLSRWRAPLDVWVEKTQTLPPDDLSDNFQVKMGNKLEPIVAELFEEATGKKVHQVKQTIYHPHHPFIAANLDRRVVGEDAVLEIKTAGGWAAKEWEDEEIPHEVILQVMHQLAVTGKSIGYAAVLIGGNQEFKWKVVERDEKAIQMMMDKEVMFWKNFVVPKIMPSSIKAQDADTLFRIFPEAQKGEKVMLNGKATAILEGLSSLIQDHKNLAGIIEQQKNEIKAMLGEA